MSSESLKKLIENIHSGKSFKVLPIIKENPEIAAFISKLTRPRDKTGFDLNRKNNELNLNQNQFINISENTKNKIKDNDDLLALFPDIELAIQTLVSSIMSPKDMVKTDIIYRLNDSELPSELSLALNAVVEKNMKNYYKLDEECNQILRETLFTAGCYVKAIIPESSVDEIINGTTAVSTESLSELFVKQNNDIKYRNLNILGNSKKEKNISALEKFSLDLNIVNYEPGIAYENNEKKSISLNGLLEVSDNFHLLKLPKITNAINKQKIKYLIKNKLSTESNDITNVQFSNLVYKEGSAESKTFVTVPTLSKTKRKSIGRPMVFKIPSEATIPVYTPGNESEHVGYFILLDIDGNPVTRHTNQDYMQGLTGILNSNNQSNDLSSMLIQKAKSNLVGNKNTIPMMDQLSRIYANIVETDLIERLKNGIYKQELSIANNEEIYRIMLARTFANKYTRIVFIPAELVTYFAFNYHENGIGKSYLDDLKILTSLRAILLFSKVMAMVKSAINLTHVNITLDPNDPDPQNTVEIASHEIMKMRQQYFPLGINSPVDLVDWIQRAGFEFSFEGHPGLPQTKLDFDVKNIQHTVPDSDLDELLRKQTYMSFGLSPETIDNGFNSEFATTVVSNNILLSKRVIQLQKVFTKHLTSHCKKIIENDMCLKDELLLILKDNIGLLEKTILDDEKEAYNENKDLYLIKILDKYTDNLILDLPKPDETSIETQVTAFDSYLEALDKTIDHWISAELMSSSIAGDINEYIDTVKTVVKSHFVRKWMADNNFMAELSDIVTTNENDKATLDLFEINKGHIEGITRSTVRFIDSLKQSRLAANKDLGNLNIDPADTSSSSDEESNNDNAGDEFGLDDTGMGGVEDETTLEPETEPEAEAKPVDEPEAEANKEDK